MEWEIISKCAVSAVKIRKASTCVHSAAALAPEKWGVNEWRGLGGKVPRNFLGPRPLDPMDMPFLERKQQMTD